ncbi:MULTISPECIES: LysR substrate-binding domain-containing protein [Burkholderia]|uniref:LysR substrate-binding domain-containing protein n=1 Tax=Burkholderia TaxID=32008 RepID=UPI00075E3300|nr:MULTISPECIES: LysR substrate-binding domain-containing protein [Burkholderia]KVM62886.1 LysR family transcriptional regulator [Burkholderia gladioli]NBI46234.1 LysR family transcriptional regulator [Burkholderia sp. ISTR5]
MILPPLNALRAFEATARLQSLSRAGEELHVTHVAVSGQIKKLEAWFGRRLLERSGRGAILTPAGEQFLKAVQPALAAISASAATLTLNADRNTVSVGCIPSVAARWLIPALPSFTAIYPDITLEIAYASAFDQFDPERHDVLITHQATPPDEYEFSLVFSRINKPVASPLYLQRGACDEQLNGATLLHDEVAASWEAWLEKAGYRPERLVNGPLYQDFNLLAAAMMAGHGVALCPIDLFRKEIASGELVVLSDVHTREDEGYYVIWDKDSNAAVHAFSKWFVSACPRTND